MATSSERSPPPFPDTEDQDAQDPEEVRGRDSDEDDGEELFLSATNTPMATKENTSAPASQPIDLMSDPLMEPLSSHTENKSPSEMFEDLTKDVSAASAATAESPLDQASDDFVDVLGSKAAAEREEVDVTAEGSDGATDLLGDGKSNAKQETPAAPIMDLGGSSDISTQQPAVCDPLVDLLGDSTAASASSAIKPSGAVIDLFDDEGSDFFTGPPPTQTAKQPQKSLFGDGDEDLFGEPLGAVSKKATSMEQKEKSAPAPPAAAAPPADLFTEEAVGSAPNSRAVNSKTNGVHSEEDSDLFAEATVELSLDSPRTERRKEAATKPSTSVSATAGLAKSQPAPPEEIEEEEEELQDKFDINVFVKDPEKIGDGMNAYMAYKVSTQTTLPMFRSKTFTVKRRFSDFLGLYEKLSEKHGPNGLIVPPPPEKSLLGMTKVKVGKEDSSSADFHERRRGALERYLQRVVNHPMLLQDPDVREFLEKEELPRAHSTQALSGAGFLKMITKATDAVSKMTIKMNESDVWFEEKLQEVESADQQFRKLHALVESLVVHRKELSLNTASFAKSAAMLGSAEDNTALSRALSQLAEVEDKMEQLHQDQASNDTFSFAELIADFTRLLGAVRGSFDQRMKAWQRWQDAQAMLQKKRETEAKLLWANKPDKLQLAKEEIVEWEAKVTQYEQEFERVSATVRKEVVRFEKEKTKNFKRQIITYLESLLQSQHQLIKYWEAFLPEAKAIA
ncbi:sorting nexin-1a [Cyprinodon tularosa]|uniref:sorting nexin-1a n=1 Tax=Cyprinodon tularosa TaxID=77115 RepID=UPI0018E23EC7|nr:sorting nexin-1a [Cyprinodon tularosa]